MVLTRLVGDVRQRVSDADIPILDMNAVNATGRLLAISSAHTWRNQMEMGRWSSAARSLIDDAANSIWF